MSASVSAKRLEMSYTPLEFRKTLFGQFTQNTPFSLKEINEHEWVIYLQADARQATRATRNNEQAQVNIKINQSAPRKIAMLSLPVLEVVFEFNALSIHQEAEFMKRFFRYFHKGGG